MKNPGGRPLTPINWDKVDELLEAGCLGTEVAAYYGLHPSTLYNRCQEERSMCFSEYSRQKKDKGDSLLRAKQFEVAMGGDRTMLVWLGKNRIGQREESNITHSLSVTTIDYGSAECEQANHSSSQVSAEELPTQCPESP